MQMESSVFAKHSNKDLKVFLITAKTTDLVFALKFLNTLHRGKFVVQVPLLLLQHQQQGDNQFTKQDLFCCIKNCRI